MTTVHVPGRKTRDIMLYGLSTCGWCQKTRKLLDDLGVEYRYVYVDLAAREERNEAIRRITEWNPSCSFPTLIIDDAQCIVGFKEEDIRREVS